MTSKQDQMRNSMIYVLPVLVSNAVPLVTLPIFTRVLSREQYGAWALAWAYAAVLTGIANFGMTISYERNFFEYPEPSQRAALLYSTLLFVLSMFTVAGAVTWIFRDTLAYHVIGDRVYAGLLFWSVCATAAMSLKVYFLTYFKNSGEAVPFVWYTVDETILGALLSVVFVAYLRVGPMGLVLGQFLASLTVLSLLTLRFLRRMPPRVDGALLVDNLRISLPLTPKILLGAVGSNIDKYLIGLLASIGGVGIYTIGQRFASTVFTYMTALENVFVPHVYQRMFTLGPAGSREIGRYLTPFAYVSVAAGLMLCLFSEELLYVATAAPFHGAVGVVNVLSLYYGILFFGKQPQLTFARKTGVSSILSFFTLGLNTGINLVLIRRFGVMGAASGTLLAGVISGALAFWAGQRYYRIDYEYGKMLLIFTTFIAAALVVLWLRAAGVSWMVRLGVKALLLGVYAAIGVGLGVITRENYDTARGLMRRRLAGAAA